MRITCVLIFDWGLTDSAFWMEIVSNFLCNSYAY